MPKHAANQRTTAETSPEIAIQNPRYEGAAPEDVGRALLRPVEPEPAQKPDDEGAEVA